MGLKREPSRSPLRVSTPDTHSLSSSTSSHSSIRRKGSTGNGGHRSGSSPMPSRHNGSGKVVRSGSAEGSGSLEKSFSGSLSSLNDTEDNIDNISVVVRVRPMNEREVKNGEEHVVSIPSRKQIVINPGPDQGPKSFTFNAVLDSDVKQGEAFENSGVTRLLDMATEGFSTTVFCYGQTGSGKTHTLTGPPHLFDDKPDPFSEDHGLVYRCFVYLFDKLRDRQDFTFVLKASFLEIYNEKVIDLLNPGTVKKPLAVRWSKKLRGFYVENLFTVECEQFDDLLAVLEEGMRNRAVGSHNMNEYSSRSHTMLTVHVISEAQAEDGVYLSRHGKINFVDLAGSEMTKKTLSQGKTLEEANNINKSLMVLGYCISQLSDNRKQRGSTHIPYRDSKLTKLLADSLAGNGVTLMIACISPAKFNMNETLNTLRYAARAKHIRNKPVIVMDPREALILSLKREVHALKEENAHLRSLVDMGSHRAASTQRPAHDQSHPSIPTPRLSDLPSEEAQDLLRSLLAENEALRSENADLYNVRDSLLRDAEAVARQNERLLRQLENPSQKPTTLKERSQTPYVFHPRPSHSAEWLSANYGNEDLKSEQKRSSSVSNLHTSTPLSQSFTLQKHSSLIGYTKLPDDGDMPEDVSKEMKRRGLDKPETGNPYLSQHQRRHSAEQQQLRKKRLTDLKIDFNFIPGMKNLTGGGKDEKQSAKKTTKDKPKEKEKAPTKSSKSMKAPSKK